jgi:hypothetical protein
MPLPPQSTEVDPPVCTLCGTENTVRAFPALQAAAADASRPQAALDGEAACFDHPGKRAVASCRQCGRFVCGLCAVDFGEEVWCPTCVASRSGQAKAVNLEPSRPLYDSMVFSLPIVSLLVWPLTALTAPATLVLGVARWNRPLSLVRRNRWRMVVGMLIALGEICAWVWGIVYLVATLGAGKS